MSLRIIGTGMCVPKLSVSNTDLEKLMDTNDEWITTRTGIKTRNICSQESLTDISTTAAVKALEAANIDAKDLDLIICSTMQGDYVTPSLSCLVQKNIGATCPSFDLNAACSGFIYALDVANTYISSNKAKNVLVIAADMMSKLVDWNDRNTCVLFGDGAGAVVVTAGDDLKYINLTANGEYENLYATSPCGNNPFNDNKQEPSFLKMNGQEIFKFAVSSIEKEIELACKTLDVSYSDIDLYLLHQANKRIVDSARTRLKQPAEKFPLNIDKFGNSSSATIPILLDEMVRGNKIKSGDTLLLIAFGAGLTTGTCVIKWS
jgi:3-oxoacyl-[acyl-carrier-protein] synthase-3